MNPKLTLWPDDFEADALAAALLAAGLEAAERVSAPGGAGHAMLGSRCVGAWLQAAGVRLDAPVSAFGAPPDDLVALLAAGLTGWWPAATLADPAALRAALALDQARWQQAAQASAELARAREQLDERKWVDRAKGVLMSARGIGEDEAFRLLRGAAMHANLRVGEVSRSVTEASQWADAINRAGQLRMLSQRVVKLAAQRLAGIDVRRARTLQDEAAQRVQDNFDHLVHLAAGPPLASAPAATHDALAAAHQSWLALQRALAQRQTVITLLDSDQRAMALLERAEALTDALEQGGARRALKLVNLCGRQRMRAQRVAKDALLATLLNEPARRDALTPLLDETEATLLELEQAPLASADTRAALSAARDEWLRLLRGLRSADSAEGRALLAASSDALLDVFDRLTASYEHSLQVIMS
ncbi:MAG TPA: type IV pili methyl-accepting chemotaxis transducer N-terminal domain-containing protein [Ideonella sp.]|nr:type IV pili methyl-accepting chemotaxis transducer N-terminal domain-containing protein [Ideonella sp.]